MEKRKDTRKVQIGDIFIGGGTPITIQSMTNTPTSDIKATVEQIKRLESAGCDIVRVAVPDEKSAGAIQKIKAETTIPIVADIHFNYRLALSAADNGADKLRINPGNIGSPDRIKAVVEKADSCNIPVRVGVNSGSIEKEFRIGYSHEEALVKSALKNIALLEQFGFQNTVVSIKASSVALTVKACRKFAEISDYPLHLGVTEAGTAFTGTIKSAAGIGALLMDGIGDTIRVSLSADPVTEVETAAELLKCLGLRDGPDIISCPTCARVGMDVIETAEKLRKRLAGCKKNLKIAVMGCSVNGPGEAAGADICVTGSPKGPILFIKGMKSGFIKENLIERIMKAVDDCN